MKGYAQSQDVSLDIDGSYMGMAVTDNDFKIEEHLYGDVKPGIIKAVYIVPFLVVTALLVIGFIVLCWYGHRESSDFTFQEKLKVIKSDTGIQANLVAAIFLCSCTTIAIFFLDCISWGVEKSAKLPRYFPTDGYGLFTISIVFSLFSLLILCVGIVGFIWLYLINDNKYIIWLNKKYDNKCIIWLNKTRHIKSFYFFIPIFLCSGSTLLMMSFHFQTILMAWSSDPFYASRVALFYGIAIFCLFISIKFVYNMSHTKTNAFVAVSVFAIFIFVAGTIVTVVIFVAAIPVNNSIEESAEGITSIYNGAVVLFGSIIAYKVGWYYFGNPFSVDDALKQAMTEIKMTPFYSDENKYWEELTEEKRMTEIMKALIHRQVLARYYTIPSALNSILTKAWQCKDGKLITVTTVQAATLTTSLAPHLYKAVRSNGKKDSENKNNDGENGENDGENGENDGENDGEYNDGEDEKNDARTSALIDALYTIVLDSPIDLTILPSEDKKQTLEKEVKKVLKGIDKSTTTLDENNKKILKEALEKALTPYD